MVDVDIFVSTPTQIDWDVYNIWLKGYTVQEAAVILQKRGVLEEYEATFGDLLSDTMHSYHLFSKLEYYLKNPQKMPEQQIFIMDTDTKKRATKHYYEFDDEVVREFLGKKLTTRTRKDLDDISERLRIPLRNCRRQFDNVKRVYKEVEDLSGNLVENIKIQMCINHNLALQYAALVFITNCKFDITKKRLAHITCYEFMHCAHLMLQSWVNVSSEEGGAEIDREFLQQLRELKIVCERDCADDHKMICLERLRGQISEKHQSEADSIFKNFSKIMVTIASNLNHSKDVRNFFVEMVEKVIDPMQHLHWTPQELRIFLLVYKESCLHLLPVKQAELTSVWERYMTTMIECLAILYPK